MSHLAARPNGGTQNDAAAQACHSVLQPTSHDLAPAAMADHHHPCPYQEKVIANPTTARVLLMFLRDFVELRTVYTQWTQSCPCPMMRCEQAFTEPLMLIEHLLSCPELPRGEFKCWKCSNGHTFPTDEKTWPPPEWPIWKGPHDVQPPLQRKRSLSDKVSKVFVPRRRRSSVDKSAGHLCHHHQQQKGPAGAPAGGPVEWTFADPHNNIRRQPPLDPSGHVDFSRLGHEASQAPNNCSLACVFGNLQNSLQDQVDSSMWDCPTPTTDSSKLDRGVPWAEMDEEMGDISSTASIYDSTNVTNSSGASRSSLGFASPLANQFHHLVGPDGAMLPTTQFLQVLSPPTTVEGAPTPSSFQAQSPRSPLSRDDGTLYSGMLSPVDLEQQGDCENHQHPHPQWWASRPGDLLALAPGQGQGFVPTTLPPEMAAASPVHGLPLQGVGFEAMDQSLQFTTGPGHAPGLYEVAPGTDGTPLQVYSPAPPPTATTTATTTADDDCPDELVCDECNWKPRGVRENLKGYLRKHKNTHKNLRFPCDVAGCTKDFGRQDNLKAHKRDKHHIDDASSVSAVAGSVPVVAVAPAAVANGPAAAAVDMKEEPSDERPSSEQQRYRGPLPEHTVLWGLNY